MFIPKLFGFLLLLLILAMAFSHIDFNDGKLAAIAPAAGPEVAGDTAAAPVPGGPFEMTDDKGQPVTQVTLVGDKYHLIFFGFTHCADACPAMLQSMAWVFDNLPPETRAKLQMVFVSVDPMRDTAANLGEYVRNFNPTFVGWYGTKEQVDAMTKGFMTYASIPENATASDPTWQAGHSTLLYVMGPDGRYITHMDSHDSMADIRDRLVEIVK